MDFDDKVICSLCGKKVRVLGMDAHLRTPACRVKKVVAQHMTEGRAPADPWMEEVLRAAGVEVEGPEVVKVSQRWWDPYDMGWMAPEWAIITLRALEVMPRGVLRELLEQLNRSEALHAELIALHRLGGMSAVQRRLREIVEIVDRWRSE